jgi:tetratricopeptide (TPR) repeat protein
VVPFVFALCLILFALPAAAQADAAGEAERAFARGDHERALALTGTPAARKTPRALAVRARVLSALGRREEAEQAAYAVIDLFNDGKIKPRDANGLWAVAEATFLLGAYRDANDAFGKAVAAAPQNLEIELAWSELFLDKHDLSNAALGLKRILDRRPDHPRALERMARVKLEQGAPFSEVEALLARALAKDPRLGAAFTSQAGMLLRDGDLAQADRALDRALAVNPRDTEALSVRAALRFVAGDTAGFERAVQNVLAVNPRFSGLYSIVADYAEWEHRYPELVELADAALRIDPEDARAHATRGLNLLRVGREPEGREALKQAWQRDRYNVLVFNTLNLYDEVIDKEYESFPAAPFLLRMRRDERPVLEPYALPLLQKAHASMARRYAVEPQAPLSIELYASEQDFAVRTSGLPHLGVQGVCFGRVLTALSPRGGEFNWGQILWHELAHVFHIALAKGRVPRWFTEGLAEFETEQARPEWKREDDRMLWDALHKGTFPPLAQLNHAFTHARGSEALTVAYYGSARVLNFLVQRFGFPAIARMLALWGEGVPTEQVFTRALGADLESLDREFRATELARLSPRYAQDFRVDVADFDDLAKLRASAAAPGAGSGERAALALGLATVGDPAKATALAREVLAQSPDQPLALFALSHLALKAGRLPEAIARLSAILGLGHDGYQLRMLLARAQKAAGERALAVSQLEAAIRLDPERHEAYALLAELSDQAGDSARLERALERWSFLEQHARAPLLPYLRLLEQRGDFATLRARAEAGLYLDPEQSELHRLLALALLHGAQPGPARAEVERAIGLARTPGEQARALAARELVLRGPKPAARPAQITAPARKSR